MSLRDCIDNAVRDGEIDPRRAEQIRRLLDEAEAEMGPGREADRAAYDRFDAEAREKARRTRLQMAAVDAVRRRIEARMSLDGKRRAPGSELPDLIEHFGTSHEASVQARYEYVRGQAHAIMDDVLFTFERDLLGNTRNKATLDEMARALHGDRVESGRARELARAFTEAAEFLHARYNAAGGNIAKRDDWGMPHIWDASRMKRSGFDEEPEFQRWREAVLPRLNRNAMIDHQTGRPLSDARLDQLLREGYDSTLSGGYSRREASANAGRGALFSRRQEHRFLVFRSGQDWLEVNEQFGAGDPFWAMMAHIDAMSRDIALMEVLGPNPDATLRWASDHARKLAATGRAEEVGYLSRMTGADTSPGSVQARAEVETRIKRMNDMYQIYRGVQSGPAGHFDRMVGDLSNIAIASDLGSSFFSTWSDNGFNRIARSMQGMPELGAMRALIRTVMDPKAKHKAVQMGLVAEAAATVMRGQGRIINEFPSGELSKRLSDTTLRASLMTPWTQATRWSFGTELMGWLGDQRATSYRDLPQALQDTFARYGIDEARWDAMRTHGVTEAAPGVFQISPTSMRKAGGISASEADALAARLSQMITTEMLYAAPNATLRSRAFLGVAAAARSSSPLVRFVIRSSAMYNNFSVTVMMLYSGRGAQRMIEAGGLNAASMIGKTLVYTTLIGALAILAKDVVNGRDPRRMDTPAFWGAAMMQGGGLGLFGDFLFSERNRFGGGQAASISGPLIGRGVQLADATVGNAMKAVQGKETSFREDMLRVIARNTPGGSIWYLRLAYERFIIDQLQRAVDEDADAGFRRRARRWERDFGAPYWWEPGQAAPSRPPDPSNMFGEQHAQP